MDVRDDLLTRTKYSWTCSQPVSWTDSYITRDGKAVYSTQPKETHPGSCSFSSAPKDPLSIRWLFCRERTRSDHALAVGYSMFSSLREFNVWLWNIYIFRSTVKTVSGDWFRVFFMKRGCRGDEGGKRRTRNAPHAWPGFFRFLEGALVGQSRPARRNVLCCDVYWLEVGKLLSIQYSETVS
jgi:hypothetical protein